MQPQSKLRRHGYHLMSLASVGVFFVGGLGILLMALPWLSGWQPHAAIWSGAANVEWTAIQHMDNTGRSLLTLACALWLLGHVLPLIALRRVGSALYGHEALSHPVARAFAWLAHSLPTYAMLAFSQKTLVAIACEVGGVGQTRFELDFSGTYLFLVACLCLYSVAHLMRMATSAADDARSIV